MPRVSQEPGCTWVTAVQREFVCVCVCGREGSQEQEIFCVRKKEARTLHLLFSVLPKRPEVKCQGD